MSKFLFESDYIQQIRPEIVSVITENDSSILERAELAAIDEVSAYLATQYDIDKIFAPVYDWAKSDAFTKGARVRLVASLVWNVATTYTAGQYVADSGSAFVYRVIGAPTAGTLITNATYFVKIGKFGAFYNCVADVTAATTEIDNAAFWAPGDTRSELVLRYLIDVVIYEIHCRINPRNVPESRIQRRDDAIKFLKLCSDPRNNIQPNLPIKDFGDKKGTDIVWNSNPKQTHYF